MGKFARQMLIECSTREEALAQCRWIEVYGRITAITPVKWTYKRPEQPVYSMVDGRLKMTTLPAIKRKCEGYRVDYELPCGSPYYRQPRNLSRLREKYTQEADEGI